MSVACFAKCCFALLDGLRRHAPGSVKVHLKYGRLTLLDVKRACDQLEHTGSRAKGNRWSAMTMRQLLQCQREITAELERRNDNK